MCVCSHVKLQYACKDRFTGFFFPSKKILYIVSCVQTLDRVSNLFLIVVTIVRESILASLSKCRRVVMSKIWQYVPTR